MKKALIVVATILLLSTGVYSVFLRGGPADTATQATPAAQAVAAAAEEQLVAEARVVPARSAALSLTSGGIVAELLVAEGDRVEAGQPLLRLDHTRASAT